jgi:hypothetical protein
MNRKGLVGKRSETAVLTLYLPGETEEIRGSSFRIAGLSEETQIQIQSVTLRPTCPIRENAVWYDLSYKTWLLFREPIPLHHRARGILDVKVERL